MGESAEMDITGQYMGYLGISSSNGTYGLFKRLSLNFELTYIAGSAYKRDLRVVEAVVTGCLSGCKWDLRVI